MENGTKKSGYGKRPIWQWVLIYIVIAAVVYGAIYFLFLNKKGGYSYNSANPGSYGQPVATNMPDMSGMPVEQSQNGQSTSSQANSSSTNIQIANYAFSPSTLTVKVGETVTWTNQDSVGHSATADDGSFDTGILAQGKSGSFTFTKPGTYTYHCSVHPMMHGTIVVQ